MNATRSVTLKLQDFEPQIEGVSYRIPGDLSRHQAARSASSRTSGRADARGWNKHAHLAAEQIEQHRHATIVGQALEDTAVVGKDTVDQPHRAARFDAGGEPELDVALLALARANLIHHAV